VNAHDPTDADTVFMLWCRLTGTDAAEFTPEEKLAFVARPQVPELARIPYEALLDAGIATARHATLPLERWLGAVGTVRTASS
jgi:sugar lactone lactonase YvrE